MVLKFRLISNEQDDFIRDFEILAEQTFFHLHMAIQDNLHFDKSQIASFFTCNQEWEKEQEITLFELSEEESAKVITMDTAVVGKFLGEIRDKMIYVFDVFNERVFFIELVEKHEPDPSKHYPLCIYEKGKAPQQLLMDQLFGSQDLPGSAFPDDPSFGEEFQGLDDLEDLGYDPQTFEDDPPDEY
jgi:hypothetical protein